MPYFVPQTAVPPSLPPMSGQRLSDVLLAETCPSFRSYALLPCNVEALTACMDFAFGLTKFVVLVGPSGWGKSHLLQAVAEQVESASGLPATIMTARDWLRSNLRDDPRGVLIIDDLQEALADLRTRQLVRHRLERRLHHRYPTLVSLTSEKGSAPADFWLRSKGWNVVKITRPTATEREEVVRHVASVERVDLGGPTVRLIARHLHGNGRSISGALRRLKMVKDGWQRVEDACQASGVLMPYLIGEEGWDPRDEIYDAVRRALPDSPIATVREMCAYFLTEYAALSEDDTANFLKVTPTQVYQKRRKVKTLLDDPAYAALFQQAEQAVLAAFESP